MSSRRTPAISTKQRLSGEPIRSVPPRASCRSSRMSNRRYLKLVEPRLATRMFIANVPFPCRYGRLQVRLNQSVGGARNHMAGHELADLRGRGRAGFNCRADTAHVATDDGRHEAAADG